ncbi:hypothetical protein X975_15401, partial [Stegodyphus mimosarum]
MCLRKRTCHRFHPDQPFFIYGTDPTERIAWEICNVPAICRLRKQQFEVASQYIYTRHSRVVGSGCCVKRFG